MTAFWDRVKACEHTNLTDYSYYIACSTPYCSGNKYHCQDCGVYLSECDCMTNNGMSGWPWKRAIARKEGV